MAKILAAGMGILLRRIFSLFLGQRKRKRNKKNGPKNKDGAANNKTKMAGSLSLTGRFALER